MGLARAMLIVALGPRSPLSTWFCASFTLSTLSALCSSKTAALILSVAVKVTFAVAFNVCSAGSSWASITYPVMLIVDRSAANRWVPTNVASSDRISSFVEARACGKQRGHRSHSTGHHDRKANCNRRSRAGRDQLQRNTGSTRNRGLALATGAERSPNHVQL